MLPHRVSPPVKGPVMTEKNVASVKAFERAGWSRGVSAWVLVCGLAVVPACSDAVEPNPTKRGDSSGAGSTVGDAGGAKGDAAITDAAAKDAATNDASAPSDAGAKDASAQGDAKGGSTQGDASGCGCRAT